MLQVYSVWNWFIDFLVKCFEYGIFGKQIVQNIDCRPLVFTQILPKISPSHETCTGTLTVLSIRPPYVLTYFLVPTLPQNWNSIIVNSNIIVSGVMSYLNFPRFKYDYVISITYDKILITLKKKFLLWKFNVCKNFLTMNKVNRNELEGNFWFF